jgi:signal transduction histidine kinase
MSGGALVKSLQVLVVDDEAGMRRGVQRALSHLTFRPQGVEDDLSYEIHFAEDGAHAYRALEERAWDLILLDYKLPDASGLDILQALQNREGDQLTIMMTAYASLEVAVSATKNGAFDFLAKPFTPTELKNVVKKATETLVARRRAAELAAEKRGLRFQFLSVLAHELKSPLAAIEGYLYLMRDRVMGNDLDAYDKVIQRSLARTSGMRKLIFDLLDLTRIESGEKRRQIQAVDLVDLYESSLETMQLKAEERQISFALEANPSLPFVADPDEMSMVFNNLLSNAVKYNRDEGSVTTRIRMEEDTCFLSVSDTGFGMSPEEKEKLFGEFVRLKNQATRSVEGSGLGLSILKKIVQLYHGTIAVESEPNVGTTFSLQLRAATPPSSKDPSEETP